MQAVFTGILPGSPMLAGVASGGVYKSTDGGATWQPPSPGNGMLRSETVWSLGSFKDNGALIYAATQSGIYISTDFGSSWTLSSDGITGITLRAWADDKYPNIYYAGTTDGLFRSITAGLHLEPHQRGHDGPRDHAVQRRRDQAHLRRHRQRRHRGPDGPARRSRARRRGAS